MANIVIIGAGLTGLSTAYHLEQKGFFDYQLFEKDSTIGGLCRSVSQDGFTFDYTGHLLHANDTYFRNFLDSVVGFNHLNSINRRSFIFSHGTYTRYPFQSNLYGLPESVISECLEGFIKRKKSKHSATSFHAWVLQNFGAGIAQHFFFPFQKKIFAYDLKKVTSTWMGRFVPSTSLQQLISGALKDQINDSIGYNAQFFYPKYGGIQFWIQKIYNALQRPVLNNYELSKINLAKKTITFTNGHTERFKVLINTSPLDQFLAQIEDKETTTLKKASDKLLCNSVINFNLGIAKSDLSTKHWIYFPESQFPFYRIGFPHNFSSAMVPEGCSSLYGEFSYLKKQATNLDEIYQESLTCIKKLFNFSQEDIKTEKTITIPHAYVIYDRWREKHLNTLLRSLKDVHIYSIGRYGEWKYSSMQEAILDGKKIAELITVLPASRVYQSSYLNSIKEFEGELTR